MRSKQLAVEKTPPLYLRIYQIMKDAIVNGDFVPGEQVVETKLAEQFKVSRTPIRDAIRQLAKDGLVVPQENGIATVFEPTIYDIAEIYVTRSTLEAQAGIMIALSRPKNLIERLTDIAHTALEANQLGDVKKVVECNTRFHEAIIHASENRKIIQTNEMMHLQIMQVRRTSIHNMHQHRGYSLNEHLQIVEALKEGYPLHINQIISEHILRAGSRMIQFFGIPETTSPSIEYLLKYS